LGQRCAIHNLALAPDGSCVLCRRTSSLPASVQRTFPAPDEPTGRLRRIAPALALGILALCAVGALLPRLEPSARIVTEGATDGERAPASDRVVAPSAALEGTLSTKNRSERSGSFFIPDGTALPLLVALHGSGGSGAGILAAFKASAARRKFAIVAPDCGFIPEAGTYTWYVARERDDPSPDSEHIDRTIDEVLSLARGRIAKSGWLAVGHSGGASSAPYLATHDWRFSAFGVLHGGAFPAAFGPLRPHGWFSTGQADPARTPAHVAEQAEQAARAIGTSLVENHVFDGGHDLLAEEIDGVVRFWLGDALERPAGR